MHMKSLISFMAICVTTLAVGQHKSDKELMRQIDRAVSSGDANPTPGCALLVAKNGQVILNKGYGRAVRLVLPRRKQLSFCG